MYCSCCDEKITGKYIAVYGHIYCKPCYEQRCPEDIINDLNLSKSDLIDALDGYESDIRDEIDDFNYRQEVGK